MKAGTAGQTASQRVREDVELNALDIDGMTTLSIMLTSEEVVPAIVGIIIPSHSQYNCNVLSIGGRARVAEQNGLRAVEFMRRSFSGCHSIRGDEFRLDDY